MEVEKAGISLWRQVGEALVEDIESGRFGTDERLPTSEALATRFNVNRHTILKAIAHLESVGLVRMERSRGTYAVVNPIEMRVGPRTWFEENLRESQKLPRREVIAAHEMPASAEVAAHLQIPEGAAVFFVTLVGEADGFPVNYNYSYLPLARIPSVKAFFEELGDKPRDFFSFSDVFRHAGLGDHRRKTIRIRARPPRREEALRLKMPATGYVLVTEVIQVDAQDRPIAYGETCYSAGRVSLRIDL